MENVPFIDDLHFKMVIFYSHVSLSEGIYIYIYAKRYSIETLIDHTYRHTS